MAYVDERISEIEGRPPTRGPFKNVTKQINRHGKVVYYYREGKGPRIRLPNKDRVTETEFRKAYQAATDGKCHAPAPERGKVAPPKHEIGKPGYVYFVRSGSAVKIGFTTAIKQRIKALQTGSADPVDVLMIMPGTDGTEKFFHDRFRDNHLGGEWFSLVGTLAELVGYKPR